MPQNFLARAFGARTIPNSHRMVLRSVFFGGFESTVFLKHLRVEVSLQNFLLVQFASKVSKCLARAFGARTMSVPYCTEGARLSKCLCERKLGELSNTDGLAHF